MKKILLALMLLTGNFFVYAQQFDPDLIPYDTYILCFGTQQTIVANVDNSVDDADLYWYDKNGFIANGRSLTVDLPGTYYLYNETNTQNVLYDSTVVVFRRKPDFSPALVLVNQDTSVNIDPGDTAVLFTTYSDLDLGIEFNYESNFCNFFDNVSIKVFFLDSIYEMFEHLYISFPEGGFYAIYVSIDFPDLFYSQTFVYYVKVRPHIEINKAQNTFILSQPVKITTGPLGSNSLIEFSPFTVQEQYFATTIFDTLFSLNNRYEYFKLNMPPLDTNITLNPEDINIAFDISAANEYVAGYGKKLDIWLFIQNSESFIFPQYYGSDYDTLDLGEPPINAENINDKTKFLTYPYLFTPKSDRYISDADIYMPAPYIDLNNNVDYENEYAFLSPGFYHFYPQSGVINLSNDEYFYLEFFSNRAKVFLRRAVLFFNHNRLLKFNVFPDRFVWLVNGHPYEENTDLILDPKDFQSQDSLNVQLNIYYKSILIDTVNLKFYIPEETKSFQNFFSPNADGINDVWLVPTLYEPDDLIIIFDYSGKKVGHFYVRDFPTGWDGTINNSPLPSGQYWYVIQGKNIKDSGLVIIMR